MDKSLQEFGEEMAHLLPRFIQEVLKRQAKELSSVDITITQIIILTQLMQKEICCMSELAKALSVTTSAATGLVNRMVKAKLVKRIAHEKDRRIINIQITQKAKKLMEDIQKRRHKMIMEMFGKLTPREREMYLKIVKKLYHSLTEENR